MSKRYRTPFDYFELIETFPRPGCAMCNLLLRDAEQFVDTLLYEYANTPATRAAFRGARGVCSEHGWLLRKNKMGNVLGIARLYAGALDEILDVIRQTPVEEVQRSALQRLLNNAPEADTRDMATRLEPTAQCVVCDAVDGNETRYIQIFTEYITDARFADTFRASEGLCLPHFRKVLRATRDPEKVTRLVEIQTEIWDNLRADLEIFIDKQSYEHIGEKLGKEGDSWVRAILRMAGEKGVFGTRRSSR